VLVFMAFRVGWRGAARRVESAPFPPLALVPDAYPPAACASWQPASTRVLFMGFVLSGGAGLCCLAPPRDSAGTRGESRARRMERSDAA
jgi:hypothetical protein